MERMASSFLKRRPGLLIYELLIAISAMGLVAAFAVPEISRWYKERLLDASVTEVTSVIRRVETEARTADKSKGNVMRGKKLTLTVRNRRVRYFCHIGAKSAKPSGYLSEGISMTPASVIMDFDENGFPKGTKNYSFIVMLADESCAKRVTVAMYTGRVRVEDAW